jgi:hypothetical protein
MGQQEVFHFLKENPRKWYTSREISEAIGRSMGSTTVCLKKLRMRKEVLYKNSRDGSLRRGHYLYMFNQR